MKKREIRKLALLRARAEGTSYAEIANQFGYESANTPRQATCIAKRYIRQHYPTLMPLELVDRREAS